MCIRDRFKRGRRLFRRQYRHQFCHRADRGVFGDTRDHPIADLADDLIKKKVPAGASFFHRYFSMGSMKNRQMGTIKRIISRPSRIMQKKHEKGRRGMQVSWVELLAQIDGCTTVSYTNLLSVAAGPEPGP